MLVASVVLGVMLGLVILGLLLDVRHEIGDIRTAIGRNSQDIRDNSQHIQTSSGLVATHVGHELRTPLTAIMGTLATLERSYDRISPDKARDLLQAAIQQADVLESLIAGMISLEASGADERTAVTQKRALRLPRKKRIKKG
jgi:signal transduction histidine kinase